MKIKFNYVILFLFGYNIIFSGCKGCRTNLYKVHEEIEYLDILVSDSIANEDSLLSFLDTALKSDSINYQVSDSSNGVKLSLGNRVIHFKNKPEEYYQIVVAKSYCTILGVYNNKIKYNEWIYSRTKIQENEIRRVKKRFEEEVLSKWK
jgi:hypothetical protein